MGLDINLRKQEKALHLDVGGSRLTLGQGDITSLEADAIVCPTNPALDTSSGVARAILQAAGPAVRYHTPKFPEPFGKVVVLPGGKLQTKFIFLTVLLGEKGLDRMKVSIRQAVERTIRYAEFLRLKSLAFPVLGSPEEAPPYSFIARVMLEDVARYMGRRRPKLNGIVFSIFNAEAYEAFCDEARSLADR